MRADCSSPHVCSRRWRASTSRPWSVRPLPCGSLARSLGDWVVDRTRRYFKPTTYPTLEEALEATAHADRRAAGGPRRHRPPAETGPRISGGSFAILSPFPSISGRGRAAFACHWSSKKRKEMTIMLDALVVAPHPDDAELGMGGTIVRLIGQGWRIGILDLTSGEPTPLGSPERRAEETAAATVALGNPWRKNLGLPNRSLEPTLIHRRAIAAVFREVRPRLIFAPYWEDAHPDHVAATRPIEDARFWSKLSKTDIPGTPFHPARILYYFSVHLRIVERPSFLIDISGQFGAKTAALRCYRSQLVDNQPAGAPGVIDSVGDRTRFWGHTVGVRHAEPFASREPVGLSSLEHFLP